MAAQPLPRNARSPRRETLRDEKGRFNMGEKLKIEKGSVQETLIIPLYGRKLCAEAFPGLYRDEAAARICADIDYDFAEMDKRAESTFWKFGALEAAMRQLDMEWEVRDYLQAHPRAAVVNMGCGLDQSGRACDNGECLMYNVDMPDIIAARDVLAPAGEREHSIVSDLNDFSWMDEVDGSDGAVFYAAGVFHYLTFDQARSLVAELARRFPGCRIVFDTLGKLGRLLMRSTFKSFGMENYDECLCVDDPAELADWVPSATVTHRPYMLGYYDMDDPAVTGFHRFLARRCDGLVKMRIFRFDVPEDGLEVDRGSEQKAFDASDNRRFWDRFAGLYGAFMSKNNAAYDAICAVVRPAISPDMRVLELACGTGQFAERLASAAGEWVATDFSPKMVAQVEKRRLPGVTSCEVADATQLPYGDASFDCVLVGNALHIMPDPDAAVREANRVLKPGGVFIAPTFVYEGDVHEGGLKLVESVGFKTYSHWTCDDLVTFISKRGFEVVESRLVAGNPAGECVLVAVRQ